VTLAALPLAVSMVVAPVQLKTEVPPPTASVTVRAPGAQRLRVWCSVGELSRPVQLGDDSYGATYTPPAGGRPAVALLAAWDEESGEIVTATVAVAARSEIPVETDAGAQVVALVHGRRSTARANAAGHARVMVWVWPGDETATVTATDAAGNATTHEVALEGASRDAVYLVAPAAVAAGEEVPVFAVTAGRGALRLSAEPSALSSLTQRAGVTSAQLRTRSAVTLTATLATPGGEQRAVAVVPILARTLPPERSVVLAGVDDGATAAQPAGGAGSASTTGSANTLASLSPWEVGAAISARYGGTVGGLAAVVQGRRRLGRFAVGLDVDARWATGTIGLGGTLAGFGARATAEGRLAVTPRVSLYLAAALGGHYARLWRTQAASNTTVSNDGGPTLATTGGVLWRIGPGLLDISAGFSWSPLLGTSLVNADGGALTVGYRAARWRRRGGGRRRAHRRRRGPGR
jgi:hypothetical protein